ncbi:hypothetical protein HHK36_006800 [Tetracentron sinense]|uniref:SPARK domain-containing protein n=1 Tax=Tetracentron sinense TaxID=13715 RepID=A0A834ZLK7_TETSI|nr:hypothetical protein HHK36_006800 [Tetracentron sinense]
MHTNNNEMSPNPLLQALIFAFIFILPILHSLPEPDPASIQPFFTKPATIPAFPEQSDLSGCHLNLPDQLFYAINNACAVKNDNGRQKLPRRSLCCPVLAAWLYSAYSGTALTRMTTEPYDLPVIPGDSETCVDNVEKALKGKGIELVGPNETCDVVYCYCGIRLHPLSCPEAFSVSKEGKLVGDGSVQKLERDCLSNNQNINGYASLGGCSKCLNRLYQLKEEKSGNSSKSKRDRKSKMHNRDCELMGLTWLLAKNRTGYIPTVSAVFRALMMSPDGSDPQSCSLNSDGMPLAVDSADLGGPSSSQTRTHQPRFYHSLWFIFMYVLLATWL